MLLRALRRNLRVFGRPVRDEDVCVRNARVTQSRHRRDHRQRSVLGRLASARCQGDVWQPWVRPADLSARPAARPPLLPGAQRGRRVAMTAGSQRPSDRPGFVSLHAARSASSTTRTRRLAHRSAASSWAILQTLWLVSTGKRRRPTVRRRLQERSRPAMVLARRTASRSPSRAASPANRVQTLGELSEFVAGSADATGPRLVEVPETCSIERK